MSINRVTKYILIIIIAFSPVILTFGQSNNYWSRNFNEESSLLSGAVVGGGAGPSAIYYNPASISESNVSKLSLNASLFSFKFYNIQNALGEGIDLIPSRGIIEPRFISYLLQPKKHPNWSIEAAFLNNENYALSMVGSVDKLTDILTGLPGDERYFASFQYKNNYRDDWIGIGSSWKLTPNLFLGSSIFASIKTLEYLNKVDIEAYPLNDSVVTSNGTTPFYSAGFQRNENFRFNNYRLSWKFGLLYTRKRFSIGVTLKSPSLNVYSDGKKVTRKEKQSNISSPNTEGFLPDYVIVDYQEKKAVKVNFKDPFSVAAGFNWTSFDQSSTVYTTVEYFTGISSYKFIETEKSENLLSSHANQYIDLNEWLSFVHGARPILNAAVGYRWWVKENLMLMTGLRTDFNYRKNLYNDDSRYSHRLYGLNLDIYHFTGGVSLKIAGQDLIAGLQYSFSREINQTQLINLTDPVEYNTIEKAPLQGVRENNMSVFYHGISFYFGATFNFINKKDK